MERLDKTAFIIRKQSEEPPAYVYWLTKTPAERLSAVEHLRKQYAGTQSGSADASVQRVLRIIRLNESR